MKKGIDISHHQGDIDFVKVKENGIKFVIIREGYRNSTDRRFFEYVKKAKEAGVIILGVYHFSYALNVKEAKREAILCVKNMKAAGLDESTLVFFDFEYDTVNKAAQKGVVLKKTECISHTIAFCEEIKQLGFTPGVYTNLDYYKNWYSKDVLNKYNIWLADYNADPNVDCLVHQYTSKGQVSGIKGNVDMNYYYGKNFKMKEKTIRSRSKVVNLASSWVGKKESDGSYKYIIDIYNSFNGRLPRGIKMEYDWSWCACTWSALAISLGYTDIMPIEISCGELIKKAKDMGCWQENDRYIPSPGDAILYDWDDKGNNDNSGWPDHIGIIEYVNSDSCYITVIEGNYANAVKKRTISINGKYIRGFITPKYESDTIVYNKLGTSKDIKTVAMEVIAGLWGSGVKRKEALERNGLDYKTIQDKVNEILNTPKKNSSNKVESTCYAKVNNPSLSDVYITTADLYCRNDAGPDKKALCIIPKGTKVRNYGYYNAYNGVRWLLIEFELNGIWYKGFSSSKYLKKD